jgi:D-sedoheptulose 7-phosphate isomerase
MTESVRNEATAISVFARNLYEHRRLFDLMEGLRPSIESSARILSDCLRQGGKIMLCGNGGSAADCQHIAAELTGRFMRDRMPLAALALSTDTSALTCIANDYSFGEVFSRQVMALGRPGDCLVAISTSGRSENILKAVRAAHDQSMHTIGLTGHDGGALLALSQHTVLAPSNVTARVQEAHIFIGHTWCGLIEEHLGL